MNARMAIALGMVTMPLMEDCHHVFRVNWFNGVSERGHESELSGFLETKQPSKKR